MHHNDRNNGEQPAPRGPRGGNSSMSIPPGADLDAGYATDDWPMEGLPADTSDSADEDD